MIRRGLLKVLHRAMNVVTETVRKLMNKAGVNGPVNDGHGRDRAYYVAHGLVVICLAAVAWLWLR